MSGSDPEVTLSEMGRHAEAVAAAEEAVRLAPGEPYAHVVLRPRRRAASWIGRRRQPSEPPSRRQKTPLPTAPGGWSKFRRKRWTAAEDHLREALRLDPNDPAALNNLGLVLSERGKHRVHVQGTDALSSPAPRSAAFITGKNSTVAFSSWKSGSAIGGMSDGSARSKTT